MKKSFTSFRIVLARFLSYANIFEGKDSFFPAVLG